MNTQKSTISFVQIYELLMFDVDQDLLLENLSTLEDKYKGETPEQKKERSKRYARSLKTFLERFETLSQGIHDLGTKAMKQLRQISEQRVEGEELKVIEDLEKFFQDES